MMAEKGKARWGNQMGYVIFPFAIALQEDPLEYVRQAKATIDRKKQSLEAICSYACAKLVLNLFGVKVYIDNNLCQVVLSNHLTKYYFRNQTSNR
jgi:hypothetical protein